MDTAAIMALAGFGAVVLVCVGIGGWVWLQKK